MNDCSAPLGIEFARSPDNKQLTIKTPSGEAMAAWQAKNPSKQVRPCDEVIAVDGYRTGADGLISAMKHRTEFVLLLRRYTEFTIKLIKANHLGLSCNRSTLEVAGPVEGAIAEYNKTCHPNFVISQGDCLTRINGTKVTRETFKDVLFHLKDGDQVALTWTRPAAYDFKPAAGITPANDNAIMNLPAPEESRTAAQYKKLLKDREQEFQKKELELKSQISAYNEELRIAQQSIQEFEEFALNELEEAVKYRRRLEVTRPSPGTFQGEVSKENLQAQFERLLLQREEEFNQKERKFLAQIDAYKQDLQLAVGKIQKLEEEKLARKIAASPPHALDKETGSVASEAAVSKRQIAQSVTTQPLRQAQPAMSDLHTTQYTQQQLPMRDLQTNSNSDYLRQTAEPHAVGAVMPQPTEEARRQHVEKLEATRQHMEEIFAGWEDSD